MTWLDRLLHWLLGNDPRTCGAARSPQWPALRKRHLDAHPYCANCGEEERVEPHHIEPVHLRPDRELDPKNLISLCEKHGCHFAVGHLFNWRSHNESVLEDAARTMIRVLRRP